MSVGHAAALVLELTQLKQETLALLDLEPSIPGNLQLLGALLAVKDTVMDARAAVEHARNTVFAISIDTQLERLGQETSL